MKKKTIEAIYNRIKCEENMGFEIITNIPCGDGHRTFIERYRKSADMVSSIRTTKVISFHEEFVELIVTDETYVGSTLNESHIKRIFLPYENIVMIEEQLS